MSIHSWIATLHLQNVMREGASTLVPYRVTLCSEVRISPYEARSAFRLWHYGSSFACSGSVVRSAYGLNALPK